MSNFVGDFSNASQQDKAKLVKKILASISEKLKSGISVHGAFNDFRIDGIKIRCLHNADFGNKYRIFYVVSLRHPLRSVLDGEPNVTFNDIGKFCIDYDEAFFDGSWCEKAEHPQATIHLLSEGEHQSAIGLDAPKPI